MEPYRRTAQYHETDQMGIIHHANYVKWMEEARVAFMAATGFGYETIEAQGVVVPVIGVSVTYKKPVRFAEEFEVAVRVERYNGKILELAYTIRNRTQGTLCTVAGSKHCFLKDGRMVALKTVLPELDRVLTNLLEEGKEETDADV
ncbi:MAG: acyl-CoA thioesterase [Clostridia bacterium]|jgi:acyl-CoA thioester hydrolase|nr:acyl-CoA thioesterase [Clostridia bacterium]